jgi:flagellar biosynthesis GTPase FlhF
MEDNNSITAPEGGNVADATITTEPVPQGGTPSTGASDAEKKTALEVAKKFEQDINNMKSSFQKTETQLRKEMVEQRKAYEASLREVRLSKMDEEERKKYEAQELAERNKNYEEEARLAKLALMERDQKDQYRDFFTSVGVPLSELVIDQDLETLVNSGYKAWKKKTDALEKKIAQMEKGKTDDDEITPPPVDSNTKGNPPKPTTWKELQKAYGSEEAVYRLIEQGQLPASILPPA